MSERCAEGDGSTRRLLVVDGERMILELLTTQLTPHGFEVITADNAWAAVAECQRGKFDLILLDLDLRRVEHSLRLLDPRMPIVYMSADTSREVSVGGAVGTGVILPKYQSTPVAVLRLRQLCDAGFSTDPAEIGRVFDVGE